MFSDHDIASYQELCREYFGEELDIPTAEAELTELVYLVRLLYAPRSREEKAMLRQALTETPGAYHRAIERGFQDKR